MISLYNDSKNLIDIILFFKINKMDNLFFRLFKDLIQIWKLNINGNIVSLEKFIYNVKITENTSNNYNCLAIVLNNNGLKYQCTRKKKHGQFCGLHYNRKNLFNTIISNNFNKQFLFDLTKENKNCLIESYYDVTYGSNLYKVNNITGNVYHYVNDDDLIKIDNIYTSNISYNII
tara:strand:- start:135 stop:659 length:525 start_codon:yes stop_codon:yes gene_type:complete